ncbi:hypothetical protein BDZ91DRAFT_790410 [Kalaharituber pfeilii]|nr:hypothetical protein BDZ91DRAFT_790410 [Kalaharituber pfeilii]
MTSVPRVVSKAFTTTLQKRDFTEESLDGQGPGMRFAVRHRNPSGEPLQPTETLYVGNMPFDITEEDLKDYFSSIGEVLGVKIIYDAKGLSKGFGYVQFADLSTAAKACENLNNTVLAGRRLNVQYLAKPGANRVGPNPPSKTLFIGNMNYEMTDDDINELFKDIKNCVDVRVAMDRRTGQPRGFAHADFIDIESAVAAKEKLSGRIFFGRALRIDFSASEQFKDRATNTQVPSA